MKINNQRNDIKQYEHEKFTFSIDFLPRGRICECSSRDWDRYAESICPIVSVGSRQRGVDSKDCPDEYC